MISAPVRRFDGIDILRGLSIVLVVIHHINIHLGGNHSYLAQLLPPQIAASLFWNGANGVTVFFAISGFLITTMTLRRWRELGQTHLRDFYRLRFARIVPLLMALLIVLSGLHLVGVTGFVIEHASLRRALVAAITCHINWLESQRGYLPGNWDVLWSLSVEEVFYIFFPIVCRMTKGGVALVIVLLTSVAVGPFARTVLTHNELWADYGYLSCMDAIALGCLAAIMTARFRFSNRALWMMRISGAAMLLLIMTARPLVRALHLYHVGLDVTVLALGTCLLQIAIAERNRAGRKFTAPIRWFGRNSYEVYLTHMFVVTWGIQIFLAILKEPVWSPVWYLGMLIVAGLLGAVVAKFYSEPLNRGLRAKRQPSAKSTAASHSVPA